MLPILVLQGKGRGVSSKDERRFHVCESSPEAVYRAPSLRQAADAEQDVAEERTVHGMRMVQRTLVMSEGSPAAPNQKTSANEAVCKRSN